MLLNLPAFLFGEPAWMRRPQARPKLEYTNICQIIHERCFHLLRRQGRTGKRQSHMDNGFMSTWQVILRGSMGQLWRQKKTQAQLNKLCSTNIVCCYCGCLCKFNIGRITTRESVQQNYAWQWPWWLTSGTSELSSEMKRVITLHMSHISKIWS